MTPRTALGALHIGALIIVAIVVSSRLSSGSSKKTVAAEAVSH